MLLIMEWLLENEFCHSGERWINRWRLPSEFPWQSMRAIQNRGWIARGGIYKCPYAIDVNEREFLGYVMQLNEEGEQFILDHLKTLESTWND